MQLGTTLGTEIARYLDLATRQIEVTVLRAHQKIPSTLAVLDQTLNRIIVTVEDRDVAVFRHDALPVLVVDHVILPRKTRDVSGPRKFDG